MAVFTPSCQSVPPLLPPPPPSRGVRSNLTLHYPRAPFQVKNSWGPEWGAEGYILLKREAAQEGGECGILEQASYPVLA